MIGIVLQRDRFAPGSQHGQRVLQKADGFVDLATKARAKLGTG
jgi:hypothetical protein